MAYQCARTPDEIDALINACSEILDSDGSKFPGMSYEDGVRAAIEWIVGDDDANPLE